MPQNKEHRVTLRFEEMLLFNEFVNSIAAKKLLAPFYSQALLNIQAKIQKSTSISA